MATKAKSTQAKQKPAKVTRTTASSARATKKNPVTNVAVGIPVTKQRTYTAFRNVNPSALIAEFLGTFLLVSAVTAFSGNAFFVGVALAVIVAALFNISGAHVNPAVTFGLWSMRRVSAAKMILYWAVQFLGAMAALLVMNSFSGNGLSLSFASFWQFDWKIFSVELIGMTIFMFGIAAAAVRAQTDYDRAAGIGLSFFLGLAIATGMLSQAAQAGQTPVQGQEAPQETRVSKIDSVALNPAIALTLTETQAAAQPTAEGQAPAASTETSPARLTVEVILGTLIGAALGGNLYLLLAKHRDD